MHVCRYDNYKLNPVKKLTNSIKIGSLHAASSLRTASSWKLICLTRHRAFLTNYIGDLLVGSVGYCSTPYSLCCKHLHTEPDYRKEKKLQKSILKQSDRQGKCIERRTSWKGPWRQKGCSWSVYDIDSLKSPARYPWCLPLVLVDGMRSSKGFITL